LIEINEQNGNPHDLPNIKWLNIRDNGNISLAKGESIEPELDRYKELVSEEEADRMITVVVQAIKDGQTDKEQAERALSFAQGIPGFRDPSKAPAHILTQTLRPLLLAQSDFQAVAFEIWRAKYPDLQESVSTALERYQPASTELYNHEAPETFLERVIQGIASKSYDETDVALMTKMHWSQTCVSFVSSMIKDTSAHAKTISTYYGVLIHVIEEIANLSPALVQWDKLTKEVSERLDELRTRKKADLTDLLKHTEITTEVNDRHHIDLQYFGERNAAWMPLAFLFSREDAKLAELARKLDPLMTEFKELRVPATDISQDRERRSRLLEVEDTILPIIQEMDELISSSSLPDLERLDDNAQTEEVESLRSKVKDLEFALKQETELRIKAQEATDEADAARIALEDELKLAESNEVYWREAYFASGNAEGPAHGNNGNQQVCSIDEAIDLALERHGDKLAVKLNSHSDVKSNYYWRPQEIYHALEWLAIDYLEISNNGESPEISIKCPGWFYKRFQSDALMKKFFNWYHTTYEGRSLTLEKHIGKGRTFNPSRTVRIAFEHDEPSGILGSVDNSFQPD
jgi:hypothetical protein